MSDLPLPALYKRSLDSSSKSVNLPTIDDETQDLIQSALRDLKEVHSRIRGLSLFSPNETLDDISTKNLVYLTLPYVFAEVENRVRTTERSDRMDTLIRVIGFHQTFVHQLENYSIIPDDEKTLYATKASVLADPSKRREAKVNQYKKLKQIKDQIQVLQKQRNEGATSSFAETDFDLVSSLLPTPFSPSSQGEEEEELDSNTDEILRSSSTLLLRMFYAQAQTQLESMEQELELLRNAPSIPSHAPSSPQPLSFDSRTRSKAAEEREQTWKLDMNARNRGLDAKGPLLDTHGRPLRPFTILPSDAAERARLQAQVFGPGYNLPTMSIDEYLQIEKERGNVITGGGPASLEQPTSSEQLQIDSEMDGTVAGEERGEEKRQKDEKWAQFKDANPRGAGNTMNRG